MLTKYMQALHFSKVFPALSQAVGVSSGPGRLGGSCIPCNIHEVRLCMQERHFKEAFSALSEAVKFKRESWQTWSNYAHAAVQTQNHLQAARGIMQVRFTSLR